MSAYGQGGRSLHVVDEFDGGVGWQVHPEETLARTSHAFTTDEGLWVLDPLDAPGLDEMLAEYGEVAGVLVCSSWHARDAGTVAARHDVPVSVPPWMERVDDRVEEPIERILSAPGDYSFRASTPLPAWQEAMLYRERDGTLYVPESLGTAEQFLVGDERIGVSLFRRLLPPRTALGDLEPARVLVGHGEGRFENATGDLVHALTGSRRRAPQALLAHIDTVARSMWESRNH